MSTGKKATDPNRRWTWGEAVEPLRRHLEQGGVVGIPSESSYGLAADPRSSRGVEAIYAIKERDRGKPLPVVAADIAQLRCLGLDPETEPLRTISPLWPAPLTVIVPVDNPWPASAGVATLAVRVPAHPLLRRLLSDVGFPVTATSANRAGDSPITSFPDLQDLLEGHDAWLVDDGELPGGAPSTMVARDGDRLKILRQGRFPEHQLPTSIPVSIPTSNPLTKRRADSEGPSDIDPPGPLSSPPSGDMDPPKEPDF